MLNRRQLSAGMACFATLSAPAQTGPQVMASRKNSDPLGGTLHKTGFQVNKADGAYQDA